MRLLPWMTELLNCPKDLLYGPMLRFQEAIFDYDQVLESEAIPDRAKLNELWQVMIEHLIQLGYPAGQAQVLLRQIEIYAHNELSTRDGLELHSLPFKYFYYYKSCDVRLMRKILLDNGRIKAEIGYDDWIIFDWVTEVNDDITDLEEDRGTFNGNRYLRSIEAQGVLQTLKEYEGYMGLWEKEVCSAASPTKDHEVIKVKTLEVINENRSLMRLHKESYS